MSDSTPIPRISGARLQDPTNGQITDAAKSLETAQSLRGFSSHGQLHRSVYIQSSDFKSDDDATNNRITVRLDEPFHVTPLERLLCHVTTLSVPFSFYNISAPLKNDTVRFSYTGNTVSDPTGTPTTKEGTFSLGGQNHSVYSFINALKDEFGSPNGTLSDYIPADSTLNAFVGTYNRASSKLTFKLQTSGSPTASLASLPNGTLTFKLGDSGINFYKLIGFAKNTDVSFSPSTSVTSSFCINMNTVTGLLLNASFANKNLVTVKTQSIAVSKILSVLPITVAPFQYMSLAGATDRPQINIPGRQLSVFDLSITTEDGLDVDFNGLGWHCSLRFDVERRHEAIAPSNLTDKLSVLGLREIPRRLPSRYTRTLFDEMGKTRESNLQETKRRAELKRRRTEPPASDTPESEPPVNKDE